jgi:WD40 repeat protein
MRIKEYFFVIFLLFLSETTLAQDYDYQVDKTLVGHTSSVHNLRFSPDGKLLATCGFDSLVILWDVQTGEMLRKWKGHTDWITEVTFSHDGSLIASAGQDGYCKVWNTESGELLGTYSNQFGTFNGKSMKAVSFVDFSPDNKYIYYGGASAFLIKARIDIPNQIPQKITFLGNNGKYYSNISGGQLMTDAKTIITSIGYFAIAVDANTGMLYKKFHYPNQGINDVIVAPQDDMITVWCYDGHVLTWDYNSGEVVKKIQVTTPQNYSAASFNQSGDLLVTGASDNIAKVWDWKASKQVATLTGHENIIRTCRFSPKQNLIATASYDKTIKIWRPKSDIEKNQVSIHEEDLKVGNTINLEHIRFERGKAIFLSQADKELEKLFQLMTLHEKMKIRLEGHTDNVGKSHLNLRLSGERVGAVKNYLVGRGVALERILVRAHGDKYPIADNTKELTRRLNRRVEVTILEM